MLNAPSKNSPSRTWKRSLGLSAALSILIFGVGITLLWDLLHILVFRYNLRPTFFLTASGSANQTLVVIPIDYDLARSIVPVQYRLLPVDTTLLPSWPEGKHPLILKTGCDNGIKYTAGLWKFGLAVLNVPFVDRIGDGHTPFLYIAAAWHDHPLSVLLASAFVGIKSNPSVISPHPRTRHAHFLGHNGTEGFSARSTHDGSGVESRLIQTDSAPWLGSSLNDLMSMPLFGPYSNLCSVHIQRPIKGYSLFRGNVSIRAPSIFSGEKVFQDVFGATAARSFYEELNVNCQDFASWNPRAVEDKWFDNS